MSDDDTPFNTVLSPEAFQALMDQLDNPPEPTEALKALMRRPSPWKRKDSQTADPILVWEFHRAPQEYRDLSPHGGDEDWIALLPAEWKDNTPSWIEMGSFGCCDVSRHELPDGRIVCIGAHA